MATKYYVDGSGNYMGGINEDAGATGVDVSSWTEVSAPPPDHASQTLDMGQLPAEVWSVYVP